ncbi:hypothetical protein MKZ38_005273 [Zalerion maritima]|uniref:Uncharacterized protein n=1 Tax=Zalerion maritima TaxID=339359 RepID=A0AAD5RKI1_9PEZI|nr:hypothetical protein MKZ38_005273 [Zalerion maritima]
MQSRSSYKRSESRFVPDNDEDVGPSAQREPLSRFLDRYDVSPNTVSHDSVRSPQTPDSTGDAANINPRIVVGLDYGTTHTGKSFPMCPDAPVACLVWMAEGAGHRPSFENLRVHSQWPNRGTIHKVASAISYSPSPQGTTKQWGFDMADNSRVLKWTKLELPRRGIAKELEEFVAALDGLQLVESLRTNRRKHAVENDIPEHICKSAVQVIQDFLYNVASTWRDSMEAESRDQLEQSDIDIVISHPANWKYDAINATVKAVLGGFRKSLFPTLRNVSLIPEPEAAALHIVQSLLASKMSEIRPGESFVVCDAGGGTVDLVTYRLESLKPFKIVKVGLISGKPCGATFVDRSFLKWVEDEVIAPPEDGGDSHLMSKDMGAGGHYVLKPVGRVLLQRFEDHKNVFSGGETSEITMPDTVEFRDESPGDMGNGILTITPEKMKELFEFSVDGTLELLAGQVTTAARKGEILTNIFMTGGFSLSPYLHSKVVGWAKMRNYRVKRPDNCWTAVAGGAVLAEMGIGSKKPNKTVRCPYRYGIITYEPAKYMQSQYGRHLPRVGKATIYDPYSENHLSQGQITWLVEEGDIIPEGGSIEKSMTLTCKYCEPGHYKNAGSNYDGNLEFKLISMKGDGGLKTRLADLEEEGELKSPPIVLVAVLCVAREKDGCANLSFCFLIIVEDYTIYPLVINVSQMPASLRTEKRMLRPTSGSGSRKSYYESIVELCLSVSVQSGTELRAKCGGHPLPSGYMKMPAS